MFCFQKGEFHALKIFETHAYRDIDREVTALQKLKHENIIHFIGVEAEVSIFVCVFVCTFISFTKTKCKMIKSISV